MSVFCDYDGNYVSFMPTYKVCDCENMTLLFGPVL